MLVMDITQPYATVYGLDEIAYQQGGVYFRKDLSLIGEVGPFATPILPPPLIPLIPPTEEEAADRHAAVDKMSQRETVRRVHSRRS